MLFTFSNRECNKSHHCVCVPTPPPHPPDMFPDTLEGSTKLYRFTAQQLHLSIIHSPHSHRRSRLVSCPLNSAFVRSIYFFFFFSFNPSCIFGIDLAGNELIAWPLKMSQNASYNLQKPPVQSVIFNFMFYLFI